MANTVTVQTLVDGPRNAVLHIYLASDGAAGDLADQVVVDVSALSGAPSRVRLERIDAALSGFSAVLEWDATADVPFLALPADQTYHADYCPYGGLINNAGAGVTGDITLTTTGFSAAGDAGHLTVWVRKS